MGSYTNEDYQRYQLQRNSPYGQQVALLGQQHVPVQQSSLSGWASNTTSTVYVSPVPSFGETEPKKKVKASFRAEMQKETDEWLSGIEF